MYWPLRPAVWFATASMAMTILHELAHAVAAYALGVPSTLFNYAVDLDMTPAQAAGGERVLIGIAGPIVCLALGSLAWVVFRRSRGSAAALPLLFLGVFGVGTFFGNLISASFSGDFSAVAAALSLPMTARYAVSLMGAVAVAIIHFWAGRELVRFVPADAGRVTGVLGVVLLPVALGTAAIVVANQPMPLTFAVVRTVEASFWLFAAVGAAVGGRQARKVPGSFALRWTDGAALVVAIMVVRLLVQGIRFTPPA